jgi:outer membrane protein assembly factor BamD
MTTDKNQSMLNHAHLRSFKWVLLISILLSVFGCASKDKKIERGSEQDLYNQAQSLLNSSNWSSAIEALQLLEEYYPFGTYAEQSQLDLIYAYYRTSENEAAVAAADRFIRLHPQHRNVDYAYYMRGISSFYNESVFSSFFPTDYTLRDPGSARDSFDYFATLIARYPESSYVPDSKQRMIYLRNTIARGEINVANYYFKRGAYLAAANRGRWVVESLQETPAVPDALAVMAQAYHLLGMQNLSDDAVSVLKLNFPNHPALDEGEFNYRYGRDEKRSWVSYLTFGLFDQDPSIEFDTRKHYNTMYPNAQPVSAPPNS